MTRTAPPRYGIYTFITTTEKPRELIIAEDLRQLAQQGDLTSAAIRGAQMMAETKCAIGQLLSADGDGNGGSLMEETMTITPNEIIARVWEIATPAPRT